MPTFNLLFTGHSGFFIESGDVKLLCDPWFSKTGAFLSSWHQFPDNENVDQVLLRSATHLYISHPHEDHYDEEYLKQFPKNVTVIIADFISQVLENKLKAIGFNKIIKLKHWQEINLGEEFSVRIFIDPSLYKMDSALVIKAGGVTVLNKNDCHIPESYFPQFRDLNIDYMFAQFSGAMWYPAVYDCPPETKSLLSQKVRSDLQRFFIKLVNGVKPKNSFHCAGPPCFLEDWSFAYNFKNNGIFPDQSDVYEDIQKGIRSKLHLILPGDEIRQQNGEALISRKNEFDFSQKEMYLKAYRGRRADIIQKYLDSLPVSPDNFMDAFKKYIERMFSMNQFIADSVNALVKFSLSGQNGGELYIDLRCNPFKISLHTTEAPNYEIEIDSRIANLILQGRETWETVFLSMRFKARRNPDLYNWPLFSILQFSIDPLLLNRIEELRKATEREKIVVTDGDKAYTIQRFCPHAGEDLKHATVRDGMVICSRHRWTFDLKNSGKCIYGGNIPLKMFEKTEDEAA